MSDNNAEKSANDKPVAIKKSLLEAEAKLMNSIISVKDDLIRTLESEKAENKQLRKDLQYSNQEINQLKEELKYTESSYGKGLNDAKVELEKV